MANVHYLRHGNFWILLATHGKHRFFDEEGERVRDARDVPVLVEGYSLSVKRGEFLKKVLPASPAAPDGKYRVRVQIAREQYRELRAYFVGRACYRSAENLARELWSVPFEPYAPVRKQLLNLLRLVNAKRQQAGFSKIPPTVLRYRRQIVKPFEQGEVEAAA